MLVSGAGPVGQFAVTSAFQQGAGGCSASTAWPAGRNGPAAAAQQQVETFEAERDQVALALS